MGPRLDSAQPCLYKAALPTGASRPAGAQVAQLVEHVTENHGVGGSIPPLGTNQTAFIPAERWDSFEVKRLENA